MKKLVAALLCLALMLQLAACGAVNTAKNAAGKVGQKAGELASDAAEGLGKAGQKAGELASDAAEGIGKAAQAAGAAVSKLSLPDFKKGFEKASDYFGTTVASLGGQDYVHALAETVDKVQNSITDGVKAGGVAVAAWAGSTAQKWKDGLFDIDAAESRQTLAASGAWEAAQRSATRQAQALLEEYGAYAASDAQPKSIETWLAGHGVDVEKTADLYFAVWQEQLRAIPAEQVDTAVDLILAAAEAGAEKGPGGRQFVAERDLEVLRDLAERLKTAGSAQAVPLKAAESEALARSARDGDLDRLFLTIMGALDTGLQGTFVAKQAIKSGATPTLLEAAVVLGPQIYEIIRLGIEDGALDGEAISEAAFEALSPAGDGYLKGAVSNALTVLCREGKLGQAFLEATPQMIGTMTVLVLDAVRYGILLGAGRITTDQYLDAMAEEVFISAGALGTAALVTALFPEATCAVLLGSFVGGLVASAGYSAAKTYVLAWIEESDIDLLVPIRATAGAIKNLTATLSVELTDALAGVKKAAGETYDKVAVKVYDLTGRV